MNNDINEKKYSRCENLSPPKELRGKTKLCAAIDDAGFGGEGKVLDIDELGWDVVL